MFQLKLFVILLLLVMSASASAQGITPAGVPKTDAGKAIFAKFNDPKQTIEYHFLLDIPGIMEKDLANTAQKLVLDPLKEIADLKPLPANPKPNIYLDSKDYVLGNKTLIVRLRNGDITVKSRTSNSDKLIDLNFCSSGKYEMDYADVPFYSVSTTLTFPAAEFENTPTGWTLPKTWAFMEKKCPAAKCRSSNRNGYFKLGESGAAEGKDRVSRGLSKPLPDWEWRIPSRLGPTLRVM